MHTVLNRPMAAKERQQIGWITPASPTRPPDMGQDHRRPPPRVLGSPAARATFPPSGHPARDGDAIPAAGLIPIVSVAVAQSGPQGPAGALPSPPRGKEPLPRPTRPVPPAPRG